MTLRKGIVWSQKKMRPAKFKKTSGVHSGEFNPIMKQVMSNPGVAQAANLGKEQKELWGLIKSVSKDGVYKKELRKLFGDLRTGKVRTRTLSKKEIMKIAKDIFPDSKRRYIFSGPAATERSGSTYKQIDPFAKNSTSGNTGVGRQSSFIRSRPGKVAAQTTTSQMTPVQMATFRNRIRNLSKEEGGEQEGGNFSRALEAMRKNKRG